MTRRERAIRAAVESLSMSREAKDTIIDIWREVDASYAEQVRDLKARLKAARSVSVAMQERAPAVLLKHVTDLRVKHWRRP